MIRRSFGPRGASSRQGGFSMIEVLIALVVLAVGLLGLALLQTTNLRYTKSANLRTQAVNLGTEMLDIIRANNTEAAAYMAGINGTAAFGAPVVTDAGNGCEAAAALTAAANITRWKCEVVEALGEEASADVDVSATNVVTVVVTWDDEFWTATGERAVTLVSQL